MSSRSVVAVVVVLALAGFLFLTVDAALRDGVTVATVLAFLVLALLGIGILGALTHRPPEE